jgi:hypothetical protein
MDCRLYIAFNLNVEAELCLFYIHIFRLGFRRGGLVANAAS